MRRIVALLAFSAVAAFSAPTVSAILNNYSYTLPSSPNYGIAEGSIFVIFGSGLANTSTPLQNAPLGTSLAGVTVTANVNGVNTLCILYYVTPTQVAGILPSSVAAGTGTFTVNNNGQVSNAATLKVVQSDFGTLTLDGSGSGAAAIYDVNYHFLSSSNSAKPNDVIQVFGSGVGPVTGDETVPQVQTNLTNIPMTAEIAGVQATILYRGRTIYPGLDQINIQIPTLSSTAYGCNVTLVTKSGSISSNTTTLPVSANGGNCPSQQSNINPTSSETAAWLATGMFRSGSVGLLHTTGYINRDNGTQIFQKTASYTGSFQKITGDLQGYLSSLQVAPPAAGLCNVVTSGLVGTLTYTYLDAGASISITGPNGPATAVKTLNGPQLVYTTDAVVGNTITSLPDTYMVTGHYTYSGTGGPSVGAFSDGFDLAPELVWTEAPTTKVIDRSVPLTVHWTGGDPNTLVAITGISGTSSFQCYANNGDHQITIPTDVLNRLPASTVTGTSVQRGSLNMFSIQQTRLTPPSGIDYMLGFGEWSTTATLQYK